MGHFPPCAPHSTEMVWVTMLRVMLVPGVSAACRFGVHSAECWGKALGSGCWCRGFQCPALAQDACIGLPVLDAATGLRV